jgi:hypothetical protein
LEIKNFLILKNTILKKDKGQKKGLKGAPDVLRDERRG